MELNSVAKSLVENINSSKIEGAASASYEIYVAKEAGESLNDEDYFTEDDIVIGEEEGDGEGKE